MYRCCWPIALLLLILKQSTIARPTIGHRHSDYRILASTRSPPTPLSERSARLGILWPWLVSQSVLGVDMSETVSLWRPPIALWTVTVNMTKKLVKFLILFDNTNLLYFPGQFLTGRVLVELKDDTPALGESRSSTIITPSLDLWRGISQYSASSYWYTFPLRLVFFMTKADDRLKLLCTFRWFIGYYSWDWFA